MREDILQILTAVDLASILLGWGIVISAIFYTGSKRNRP